MSITPPVHTDDEHCLNFEGSFVKKPESIPVDTNTNDTITEGVILHYDSNPNLVKLYSVFDSTAKMFAQPFVGQSDDVVKRNLKHDILKDRDSLYFKENSCFTLCRVGWYNILSGDLISHLYDVVSFTDLINTDDYKL